MHIPDGYLSPSTCGILVGAATPFWYTALCRVQKTFSTRMIPLLSVFAAFSFVIMMFNLPLPGGTTGHAVGMGVASIVLGPWAAMLAISIALVIQAVFFGDGGITAIGANCFNMAIVGSLVGYATYRLISFRATLGSARRVLGAGIAGYLAINIAALCAAIEFGIQPLLFKDPSGAPLYAPYPLRIAIPAMMSGHLTFAGLAEMVLTGGVVAYFQRSNPSMLEHTAPGAVRTADESAQVASHNIWGTLRPLWTALALLLALTPLGVLAGGAAWGEWGAGDFSQAAARQRIAVASSNMTPPLRAPQGLERLCSVWTAPFPQYAPAFVRRPAFGYLLSAMFGSGIIFLISLMTNALWARRGEQHLSTAVPDDSSPLTKKGQGVVGTGRSGQPPLTP